jgi:hypothetical protein
MKHTFALDYLFFVPVKRNQLPYNIISIMTLLFIY